MTAQERAELASMYERNPEAAVYTIERLENRVEELETQLSKDREGINYIYNINTRKTKMLEKTLQNTDVNEASKNVPDLVVFGNGNMFKLLSKASSQAEGWMKSSKAMEIEGVGCVVQVTTQQKNPDGSYVLAEALTYVPGVKIEIGATDETGKVTKRKLVAI